MATEVERLVATLEANIKGYERSLQKALQTTNKQLSAIEKRAKEMQSNLSSTLGRGFAQLTAGVSVAALAAQAVQAADSYTKMGNALRTTGLTAAEVSATFEQLYKIAQANGTAIEPLVTLYTRVGVAQKELGASTSDLIDFTNTVALALRAGGVSTMEASGALLQLSQAIGGTVVTAEEFSSLMDGGRPILQAAANGIKEAEGSVNKLRQIMLEGNLSSKAFFFGIQAGRPALEEMSKNAIPTVADGLSRVSNSFTNLVGKINENTGATRNLADSLQGIASFMDHLPGAIDATADAWTDFKANVNAAADALNRFMGIDTSPQGLRAMGLEPANETRIGFGDAFNIPTDPALAEALAARKPGLKPISINDFKAPKKEKKGRTKKERENEFEREIKDIQRRTEALDIEAAVIGRSTLETAKYRATQDLLNAAKEAGVKVGETERAKIDALALSYAEAAKRVEDMEKAYQAAQEQAAFFGDLLTGALTDMLVNGASAEDVIKRLTAALAQAAIEAALLGKGPLAQLFGGGGGILGSLLGGLTGIPGRASGGPVRGGQPYLVGETGPEMFVPSSPGRIVPRRALGGGTVVHFAPVIDARGADSAAVARLEAQMRAQSAALPKVIAGQIRSQNTRGTRA